MATAYSRDKKRFSLNHHTTLQELTIDSANESAASVEAAEGEKACEILVHIF